MELGALLVTRRTPAQQLGEAAAATWSSNWPVVGKTVVERWLDRLRGSGVGLLSVVNREGEPLKPSRTMLEWANGGVERILLVVLGAYAEIDLPDLLFFHHQGNNRITQVFDRQGPLGVSLHDRRAVLKHTIDSYQHEAPPFESTRYDFRGYVTRLSTSASYQRLVQDALGGRCEICPAGQQVQERVWIEASTQIHPNVRIQGPCYIGEHVRLHSGVCIKGGSSVEQGCEIDVGTTIDEAIILPNTYLASGLHLRNAIVDQTRLEHLEKRIIVDLGRAGLASGLPVKAGHRRTVQRERPGSRGCVGQRGPTRCREAFSGEELGQ